MDDPISPARRTLLKASAVKLATPVAAAIAQQIVARLHWLSIAIMTLRAAACRLVISGR